MGLFGNDLCKIKLIGILAFNWYEKNKEPGVFRLFAQQKRTLSYDDLPFSFLAFFSARFSFNDFAGSFFASFFASNPFDMAVIFRVINLIFNTKGKPKQPCLQSHSD